MLPAHDFIFQFKSQILMFDKELTFYQTTKSRLVLIECICQQQNKM